ncbi:type IVa pilus pseudopilin TppA [Ideonella azotifigens]|uniref:Type IVa pilus pseudopilin TppA n=2 Tax=Ideonella azotifigens TaxID=513160 RepID=A0ABN1K6J2_9BURK
MIVVAIVAILAAIAYPSYTSHMLKGRRADAETVMYEAAQYLQRFYAANNTYAGASLSGSGVSQSPKSGDVVYYEITLGDVANSAQDYSLQAEPKGVQLSDPCGTLTLSSTGQKGQSADATVAKCWQ